MYYLYVTPFFPSPEDWRGAYCFDCVKALQRMGKYRVVVMKPGAGGDYEIDGIKVWRFPTRQLPTGILPFLFNGANEKSFLAAVRRAGVDFDSVAVCHAHGARLGIYALAMKRMNSKCKALLHHHDLASFGLNIGRLRHWGLYNCLLFRQFRAMHEAMDCHVFISNKSRESFQAAPDAEWSGYDDYKKQMRIPKMLGMRSAQIKRSYVLHNGVDMSVFSDGRDERDEGRTGKEKENFVIGCIANFIKLKRQIDLIQAVEMLSGKRVRLRLVGSGPELRRCKEYAREHGMEGVVSFESEVRHEDLRRFYRELDLFVLPSIFEGFGCVYTEAWASGVPFIACEGQGIEDVIRKEDRGMWLCKEEDPRDLAEKILGYMDNPQRQVLAGEVDINMLVRRFAEFLERAVKA